MLFSPMIQLVPGVSGGFDVSAVAVVFDVCGFVAADWLSAYVRSLWVKGNLCVVIFPNGEE